jgi:hypothetical protein
MRLEIFRRINQGGTPLSGQDIRLAYYGEKSPSLALIRLAGVPERLQQLFISFDLFGDSPQGIGVRLRLICVGTNPRQSLLDCS